MKNIIFVILMMPFSFSFSQSQIVELCSSNVESAPANTYFADLSGDFDKFLGLWKFESGQTILQVRFSKISMHYFPDSHVYKDFLVGDYSFTQDGGLSYNVNTIAPSVSPIREDHPIYTPCPGQTFINCSFKDIPLNKGYATAIFEFVSGSLTHLKMNLKNPSSVSHVVGEARYNFDFTFPTEVILIKQ